MELKCTKCLEVKPSTEFYKDGSQARGFRYSCKNCGRPMAKARAKAFYLNNKDKVNEKGRDYYYANKEMCAAQSVNWKKNNPNKVRENTKRERLKYPKKYKARCAVNNALASKNLIKPNHCSKCKEVKTSRQIHGHHWSYLKENWLDVVWVCAPCHAAIHNGEAL